MPFTNITDICNQYSSRPSSPVEAMKLDKPLTSSPITHAFLPLSDGATPQLRRCTNHGCRTLVSVTERFKHCEPCRRRYREKYRQQRDRKQPWGATSAAVVFNSDIRVEPMKRKATDPLEHLPQQKAKLDKAADVAHATHVPPSKTHVDDALEFQFAHELHEALRITMRRRTVTDRVFRGTYAIISEPDVSLYRRAVRVQLELKKDAKLRLGPVKDVVNIGTGWRSRYPCECTMAKKPKQPLYHAVEGLSSRDREPSDSNPLYITPNRNAGASCGGEVIITCCGDKTHPYLPGEWITVEVKH